MSIPGRLTKFQRRERANELFEAHRYLQLRRYYPVTALVNTLDDPLVTNWSLAYDILKVLRDLLPFGRHLTTTELTEFFNTQLSLIANASLEQLLYWHLARTTTSANEPIEQLLLTEDEEDFWSNHVHPNVDSIRNSILQGNGVSFLCKFLLNHEKIELQFHELRLADTPVPGSGGTVLAQPPSHRLVIVDGKEFTYHWSPGIWETTLDNPDPNAVNPVEFHFAPVGTSFPVEPAPSPPLVARIEDEEDLEYTPEPDPPESLPPSSTESTTVWDSSSWENTPNPWSQERCFCRKEVCDCGYRPDTPPTPPGITLWQPGNRHLPYRP